MYFSDKVLEPQSLLVIRCEKKPEAFITELAPTSKPKIENSTYQKPSGNCLGQTRFQHPVSHLESDVHEIVLSNWCVRIEL